jgi:hypothetical protein
VAARTAQQTNEQETQLPRLLRGGEGFCGAVPEGLTLVKVPPEPAKKKDAEAEKKGEKKGEGKAAKEDRTADGAEKSKGGANSPDAGSEPGKSEPKAESPPATPPGASERGAKGGAAVADPPEPKAASDAGPAKDSKSPTKPRKTAEAADKASPPAKADKKGEGKGEKEEAKGDKEDEKSEAPAKAAEAKSGPPVAAPAAEAAPASVPALLAKAWQHRDRMRLRSEANPWSPVDYAPHLWREYNEMLLGFELRHRYDVALPQQRRNALRDLAAGDEGTSGLSDESILGRLRRARQDFFGDAVKLKKFEQARGEGLGEIEEAMRLRNDLMFAAPYYVRWHAQIAMTASTDSPLYGRIAKLLDEDHLPKLVRLLESLENPPASDSAQYDLDDLRKTKRSVEDVGTELENGPDGPRRVAEELL